MQRNDMVLIETTTVETLINIATNAGVNRTLNGTPIPTAKESNNVVPCYPKQVLSHFVVGRFGKFKSLGFIKAINT